MDNALDITKQNEITFPIGITLKTSINTLNKYCCSVCKKAYTRKSSLDKHKILCDFKSKTKQEHQVAEEESGDTPTHEQLVKIVQELTFKYVKMADKIEHLQKWVNQKKQKIKVIDWLNEHVSSTIGFKEWITLVQVLPDHALSLFENNIFQTSDQVLLAENQYILCL